MMQFLSSISNKTRQSQTIKHLDKLLDANVTHSIRPITTTFKKYNSYIIKKENYFKSTSYIQKKQYTKKFDNFLNPIVDSQMEKLNHNSLITKWLNPDNSLPIHEQLGTVSSRND